MIPVTTDSFENSTGANISIFSENNFCIFDIKLLSIVEAPYDDQAAPVE